VSKTYPERKVIENHFKSHIFGLCLSVKINQDVLLNLGMFRYHCATFSISNAYSASLFCLWI
jgi:hypothetical protein